MITGSCLWSEVRSGDRVALVVKNPLQEMRVWSLGREDPLEKEMATHSRILAWKIPWTGEAGGLQSMGWQLKWLNTHTEITGNEIHSWTCMLQSFTDLYLILPLPPFPAPGGLWVGAVHPALCWVPDPLWHPQWQPWQDEPVGEEVLWEGAEESGSILRGLGLACREGGGFQPGLSAWVGRKPHEGIHLDWDVNSGHPAVCVGNGGDHEGRGWSLAHSTSLCFSPSVPWAWILLCCLSSGSPLRC